MAGNFPFPFFFFFRYVSCFSLLVYTQLLTSLKILTYFAFLKKLYTIGVTLYILYGFILLHHLFLTFILVVLGYSFSGYGFILITSIYENL